MSIKKALFFALSIYFGGQAINLSPQKFHEWVMDMHKAQIKLLKIDWGLRSKRPIKKSPE